MQCIVKLQRVSVENSKQERRSHWWATLKVAEKSSDEGVAFVGTGSSVSAALVDARKSFEAFSKEAFSVLDELIEVNEEEDG